MSHQTEEPTSEQRSRWRRPIDLATAVATTVSAKLVWILLVACVVGAVQLYDNTKELTRLKKQMGAGGRWTEAEENRQQDIQDKRDDDQEIKAAEQAMDLKWIMKLGGWEHDGHK